jgi:hypothetical protein
MFHIRQEGQDIKQGFNFYSLKDAGSAGLVVRLFSRMVRLRFSKMHRQWFLSHARLPN